jgi:hypothetical protein
MSLNRSSSLLEIKLTHVTFPLFLIQMSDDDTLIETRQEGGSA